ncbi:hypothetical protein Ark11_0832 [Candidatus Ichthyocystis hellenicum]|uniref:Uncharacterized protein n=1 Tax=Candidatus Ichthyocystis hellenicum TaxID=1561003 RepID=A0A0S4M1K0_9BURK|nr:hypothetical protein Ark11_0832 [Candidatus Ichthyocystis hellenicum]
MIDKYRSWLLFFDLLFVAKTDIANLVSDLCLGLFYSVNRGQ